MTDKYVYLIMDSEYNEAGRTISTHVHSVYMDPANAIEALENLELEADEQGGMLQGFGFKLIRKEITL